MRFVICAKEVLDPDAVDNYALAGKLEIGPDGKTIAVATIPRLLNAYDEQALEAALRLRDAGAECTITVVSAGLDQASILKHTASLGADEIAAIPADVSALDSNAVARLLASYIHSSGGADLVLCGRQASDDDQGVVPSLIAEFLGMPVITIARAVELAGDVVRVTRVTPEGDEVVEAKLPAVITVSSELGQPRYPTTAKKMAARRMQPKTVPVETLGLGAGLEPRVRMIRQFVPAVQGKCEFLSGSPAEVARQLVERLRAESVLQ